MCLIDISQTLPDGREVVLKSNNSDVLLTVDQRPSVRLKRTTDFERIMAFELQEIVSADSGSAASLLGLTLQALFDSRPQLCEIELILGASRDLSEPLFDLGLAAASATSADAVVASRGMLRQIAGWYLPATRRNPFPLGFTMSDGKRHPLRPPVRSGEVYRRYLPQERLTISFRTVDAHADLDIFHAWHNNPRVSAFWELAGSKEMHRNYLHKVAGDAHMHPVFGCYDGEPFGYFEIYWAKEDRIAPYYEVDDYDRGVHMLVGEERWRGPHRVASWLPSLAHFMLLDDPRTRHVVAEPRADNAKMIGYMQQAGFCKPKEFNFPHKRAALMMLSREAFFDQFCV
jgi:RimJ/RimL family protein N-acetyltransferase